MPYIDLNIQKDLSEFADADFVIIGAGAAGILIATELSKKKHKVVLIESGHFSITEENQALNTVDFTGKTMPSASCGRFRAIGGTTLKWGGGSLPFSKSDIEKKDWIEHSGWPIGYEEISAHYNAANRFMGIDELDYQDDIFDKIRLKDPGFETDSIQYHVCKWAPEPNFHTLYNDYLQQNVDVIYNALFISFDISGELVSGILLSDSTGRRFQLKTKKVIIAAGGIESVRILLNNNIGNHSGWLGKCFMEHPCIEIGEVVANNNYLLQKYFNTHIWQGRKYSIRMSLGESIQKEKKLLNCSASLMFTNPDEEFNPYSELMNFKKDFKLKRLIRITGSVKSIAKSVRAYISGRFYYKDNAKSKIVLMIEQEPKPDSNISLSGETDRFGIPKATIDWTISKKTWETALVISRELKNQLERLNFGHVYLHPKISHENKKWLDDLSDVNHHMGGTRMSLSPDTGVVNPDLQVWNYPNLYVCSCSVFPTSSHSNPTLTLLALGKRLVEFLDKQKKAGH